MKKDWERIDNNDEYMTYRRNGKIIRQFHSDGHYEIDGESFGNSIKDVDSACFSNVERKRQKPRYKNEWKRTENNQEFIKYEYENYSPIYQLHKDGIYVVNGRGFRDFKEAINEASKIQDGYCIPDTNEQYGISDNDYFEKDRKERKTRVDNEKKTWKSNDYGATIVHKKSGYENIIEFSNRNLFSVKGITFSSFEEAIEAARLDDYSEIDQKRFRNEAEFVEDIKRENIINKKIQMENKDFVITPDGSYPGFYKQKKKIVIIGREDRGLEGADYNDTVGQGYKEHKIGVANNKQKTPDAYTLHRRSLKFTKGLISNSEFKEIPNANTLADELGEEGGFSFAYVNASKASNLRDDSQKLNKLQYEEFIDRSQKAKYLEQQMDTFKPSIAIGMNLDDNTVSTLGEKIKLRRQNDKGKMYEVTTKAGNTFKFINSTTHFAATKYSDEELYNGIKDLLD